MDSTGNSGRAVTAALCDALEQLVAASVTFPGMLREWEEALTCPH